MAKIKAVNPFYVLLVIVSIVFTVTASAYGVMTYRAMHFAASAPDKDIGHPLWTLMDDYGMWLLLGQLALLGAFTAGAIGTDRFWDRRR